MHLRRLDRARRARTTAGAKASRWVVVVAGGQGIRLRSLIHQVYGADRPKQFAVLRGTKSLPRQTLDRATLLVPAGPPWLAAVRAACAAEPSRIARLCRLGHEVVNPGLTTHGG